MKRLIPVRTSRDNLAYDEKGRLTSAIIITEYELRDVTDGEYEQLMSMHESMFNDVPVPRRDKSKT